MSSADTNNPGLKLQDVGENLNTWGNPNLNNDFVICSNLASKFNSITINGDYSFASNTVNYATNNPDEVALVKTVAGSVAANFTMTLAARQKHFTAWNGTLYAQTMKLATSAGFSLPAGGIAMVATDGASDVYNVSPTHCGTSTQATDSNAYALWGAVQTAIATASFPATAGTSLVSGTDTAAGYLGTKLTVSGSLTKTITNPTGNAAVNIDFTFDEGQGALYAGVFAL